MRDKEVEVLSKPTKLTLATVKKYMKRARDYGLSRLKVVSPEMWTMVIDVELDYRAGTHYYKIKLKDSAGTLVFSDKDTSQQEILHNMRDRAMDTINEGFKEAVKKHAFVPDTEEVNAFLTSGSLDLYLPVASSSESKQRLGVEDIPLAKIIPSQYSLPTAVDMERAFTPLTKLRKSSRHADKHLIALETIKYQDEIMNAYGGFVADMALIDPTDLTSSKSLRDAVFVALDFARYITFRLPSFDVGSMLNRRGFTQPTRAQAKFLTDNKATFRATYDKLSNIVDRLKGLKDWINSMGMPLYPIE